MKDNDCIFCLLANGDIPTAKIYEDNDAAVILDAGPATKGHALVMPKEHYSNLAETPANIAAKLLNIAIRVGEAQMEVLGAKGYNILANTNEEAGQTVFHTHIHVIPRYGEEEEMVGWTPHEADKEENAKIAEELKAAL